MELRDYIAALRRHWPSWAGIALVGLVVALAVVQFSPRTYQATAQVFVSSAAGAASPQFVAQRVKSYPDVAVSASVLAPASEQLAHQPSLRELRASVSASNPADTSQIDIVATDADPETAAAVANAVAAQFTAVVEQLEKPANGDSPVSLTVTNPATAPTSPVSPQTLYVLVLGLAVGLFAGLAVAIVRSRLDGAVHDEDDVRRWWGEAPEVAVLTTPAGRTRPGRLAGRPAATLARRLEVMADAGQTRLTFLTPAAEEQPAAQALAEEVARELDLHKVSSTVAGSPARPAGPTPRVTIQIADPLASLRVWRSVAASTDGLVLVVPSGRVPGTELQAMRGVLADAGLAPLAVVLTPRPSRLRRARSTTTHPVHRPGGLASAAETPAQRTSGTTGRPLAAAAPRR